MDWSEKDNRELTDEDKIRMIDDLEEVLFDLYRCGSKGDTKYAKFISITLMRAFFITLFAIESSSDNKQLIQA